MSARRLSKTRFLILSSLVLLATLAITFAWVRTSRATPGSAVTVQLLSSGFLTEPVGVKVTEESKVKMDVTQLQTYKITFTPGGYTGWHQHGGPHLIIVSSGTITYYEGDDPTCNGVEYSAGSAILDPGFDTHFVRNEGSVDAVTYVSQMLPEGGVFRIDVPAPGNCDF